jgi:hypothetical protein
MRKNLNWIAAGIIGLSAIVGGAAVVGCTQSSGTTRPEVKDLKEGVNLVDTSDPKAGIAIAYRVGPKAIYFETAVGPMKPEVYRKMAPSEPQNEMDLRILDKDGNTFYVVRGGDKFVDPTWDADLAKSLKIQVDPKVREEDFRMARDAAVAMKGVLPVVLADHAFHFDTLATRPLPSEDARMVARTKEIQAGLLEKGYSQSAWYSNVAFETDLYAGQVCWGWICPAWHSATRMWVNQGGVWTVSINACNHGRCASDSGMGYKCYSYGSGFSSASLWAESNSGSNTSVSGGCTSPYSWNDGGGQHLCNSDASYELFQAKLGGYNGVINRQWEIPGSSGNGDWNNFRYTDRNGNNFSCGPGSHSGSWSIPACP